MEVYSKYDKVNRNHRIFVSFLIFFNKKSRGRQTVNSYIQTGE